MEHLFIGKETQDIRKEVMYVAYAVAVVIVILAVAVGIGALMNPQNIDFGIMYD